MERWGWAGEKEGFSTRQDRVSAYICELEHQPPRRSRFAVIEVRRKLDLEQVSFFTGERGGRGGCETGEFDEAR